MASQVRVCNEITKNSPWWAMHVAHPITSTSTVKEFEELCIGKGGWERNDKNGVGLVLRMTAKCKNPDLVNYILRNKGGKAVVNRGDNDGQTPLFYACTPSSQNITSQRQVYETVDVLLQHGADPNLAASNPRGATPLWVAANRVKDFALCRLLLVHGAQLGDGPLSPEGRRVLGQARDGLAALIHNALDDHLLPPLVGMVVDHAVALLPPLAGMVADYAGAPPANK